MIQTHKKYVLTPKDKVKVQVNDWSFMQLWLWESPGANQMQFEDSELYIQYRIRGLQHQSYQCSHLIIPWFLIDLHITRVLILEIHLWSSRSQD